MLSNVMLLALKFHWSRADIMNLPIAEFEFYVTTLADLSKPES
jgi:hypothetical protein